MLRVTPKNYIAVIADEAIYWTDSKNIGKYELFKHCNM